jgi:hypothetical protein
VLSAASILAWSPTANGWFSGRICRFRKLDLRQDREPSEPLFVETVVMSYLTYLWSRTLSYADRLSPHHWFWILVVILIVGAFLLRGFGSRKHY